ncbi:MAG TPA: hypothetical protein VGM67_05155 [Gemmatimonadaceae bacterium]|jgi:hypothetical protein
MRHTLRLHGVVIGYSELEDIEPGVGRASGAFRPGLGYELVQPVFRIFALAVPRDGSPKDPDALERYYSARDALALELVDGNGEPVTTSSVHIADYTIEEGSAAIAIDVLIKDERYWQRRATGPQRPTALH